MLIYFKIVSEIVVNVPFNTLSCIEVDIYMFDIYKLL